MNRTTRPIKFTNDRSVINILDFDREIRKGGQLDLEQEITVEDATIVMGWMRSITVEVEHHRIVDELIVIVIRGLGYKGLSDGLQEFFQL